MTANAKNARTIKASLPVAYDNVKQLLETLGIEDDFVVTIHETTAHGGRSLAQYRAQSHLRNGVATIWVSPRLAQLAEQNLLRVDDVLTDTLMHEYGHVIWEWASYRGGDKLKKAVGIGKMDEEDFAEGWARGEIANAKSIAKLYRDEKASW